MFLYAYATNIIPGFRPVHSGVTLEHTLNENEPGKGYCKFYNSLLKDHNYKQTVKDTISDVKQIYSFYKDLYKEVRLESDVSIN